MRESTWSDKEKPKGGLGDEDVFFAFVSEKRAGKEGGGAGFAGGGTFGSA